MKITVDDQWRVTARMRVESAVVLETAQVLFDDFQTFLTTDPLHQYVEITDRPRDSHSPISGAAIVIRHELLGIHIDRIGRVLRFKPGRELAVSDLSQRGNTKGFPHICRYLLTGLAPGGHSLLYEVRGRWIARWVPRFVVRLWIYWVLAATRARMLDHLSRCSQTGGHQNNSNTE